MIKTRWRFDNIRPERKWEDLWVGVFWKKTAVISRRRTGHAMIRLDIWICVIPCFPLHVVLRKNDYHYEGVEDGC